MKKNILRLIIPGVIGNTLEWYDFALYGYFSTVIAADFFPSANKTISLLATFSVFAVGFLMRPLGATIFGHFGDKYGRKKTLATTILLMSIPTTLMGLLPTYQQIGLFAPLLLILCRLCQGVAVGGEFTGSVVYVIEHAQDHRGWYGSWTLFSCYAGMLLASGVGAFSESLDLSARMHSEWAWRIPFLFGSLLGVVGLYLRTHMPETPTFTKMKEEKRISEKPISEAFSKHPFLMLLALAVDLLPAMASYLIFIYITTFLKLYSSISLKDALLINTFSIFINLLTIPIVGYISDRIGRKPIIIFGALCFCLLSYPLFLLLKEKSIPLIILVQGMFAVLLAISEAIIPATLVEMFPASIRYTALSISYSIANGVFGGTAPLIATFLIDLTQNNLSPSYYLILFGIITLVSSWRLKETYHKQLHTVA